MTILPPSPIDDRARRALREELGLNALGYDGFGLSLRTLERWSRMGRLLYEDYFDVRALGVERVPSKGPVMLVANHSGQIPLDAVMIMMALLMEGDPPRLARGMIERWFPTLPFVGTLASRCGQILGDPQNCRELLAREQVILVFPEGVRGIGKPYRERYELKRFGTGFMRLALECNATIVPVAVVGAEETYPGVGHSRALARLFGLPYFPITPTWPLLGPLGLVPLPVRIELMFGQPLRFEASGQESDETLSAHIAIVRHALDEMLRELLEQRTDLAVLGTLLG